jgi:putative MATE family efflux protein
MFKDRAFLKKFISIALPISLQALVSQGLNVIDVMMIGQLGEVSVASVGLSNQVFFLFLLSLFGITSGMAIFTAQYWGAKDVRNIHRVQGLSLLFGLCGAVVFAILAILFPAPVLRIYTEDAEVVALGSEYLRIVGFSYFFYAITLGYASVLRSVEQVKLPMIVSASAMIVNSAINYLLIFGNFGFPQLGVQGAAIATLISRILEATAILIFTYRLKLPAAARFKEMVDINWEFVRKILKTIWPVVLNEVFWSLGITTYNIIYAHIGTESIAAINITSTIESLAFVAINGIGHGCAVMVGNQIGAGNVDLAITYGKRLRKLSILGAVLIGMIIFLSADGILSFYKVSLTTAMFAKNILRIFGLTMWLRVNNFVLFIGVLRSGGDTRFALIIELFGIWAIGVPLAYLGASILDLPVYWVYALVAVEEAYKFIISTFRFKSKKWINNLAAIPNPAS